MSGRERNISSSENRDLWGRAMRTTIIIHAGHPFGDRHLIAADGKGDVDLDRMARVLIGDDVELIRPTQATRGTLAIKVKRVAGLFRCRPHHELPQRHHDHLWANIAFLEAVEWGQGLAIVRCP